MSEADVVSDYLVLSIDEVEGNVTLLDDNLREKVFCVLGSHTTQTYTPVHTQTFNTRFLSALTLKLRTYDRLQKIFVDVPADARLGLWFKLTTEDC